MSGLVFDINVALPELMMAIAGLGLLLLGVFLGEKSFRAVTWATFCALGLVFLTTVTSNLGEGLVAFGGLFRIDAFGLFMKGLVLLGSMVALVLSIDYFEREGFARFEYPVLVLFATLGMMLMISANDLMTLYVGLELQSLALYVVAAIRRDHAK